MGFIKCLNKEEKPLCTLDDGIKALKICLAIKKSGEIRKEVKVWWCNFMYDIKFYEGANQIREELESGKKYDKEVLFNKFEKLRST